MNNPSSEDNPSSVVGGEPLSSPYKVASDEEMMTTEQQRQHTAADSPNVPDQPANGRSKTTLVLIALIVLSSVVIIALSVALARNGSGSSESGKEAVIDVTLPLTPFPSFSPSSSRATIAIPNWDLNYIGIASDFGVDRPDEITFMYEIGAGRLFKFSLFAQGCMDNITGLNYTITTAINPTDDYATENLDVILAVKNMSSISKSNIWNENTSTMEFCIMLQLISVMSGMVIREEARNFALKLVNVGVFGTQSAVQNEQQEEEIPGIFS